MSEGRHSYVRFFPSDWIGGTARMTPMQELVYFRICCWIWDKAEPVPASELPLMLGGIDGWREIVADLIAAGKLDDSPAGSGDGSVGNSRAISEAKHAFDLWNRKSSGGKRGAAKTNAKSETGDDTPDGTPAKRGDDSPAGSADGIGPGVPTQNQNQNQNQTLSLRSRDARAERKAARDGFAEWYERYPHKVGRADAERAYAKARKKVDQATLLAGLDAYIAAKPADRSWCNPATWLNQERWADQPADDPLAIPPYLRRADGSLPTIDAYIAMGRNRRLAELTPEQRKAMNAKLTAEQRAKLEAAA